MSKAFGPAAFLQAQNITSWQTSWLFFQPWHVVRVVQLGRRQNEKLPSALKWQNCVYTITWKPANGMVWWGLMMLRSGNYSSLVTCFTADWFVSHRERILIWSGSFMHKGLAINKGLWKWVLKWILLPPKRYKWIQVNNLLCLGCTRKYHYLRTGGSNVINKEWCLLTWPGLLLHQFCQMPLTLPSPPGQGPETQLLQHSKERWACHQMSWVETQIATD